MTAFARTEGSAEWGSATWELRSVNNRFLDLGLRLPEEARALDPAVRERVGSVLTRGKVECSLRLANGAETRGELRVNEALAMQVVEAARIVARLVPAAAPPTQIELLRWPGVVETAQPDQEGMQEALLALLDRALAELCAARAREGERIRVMLEQRLDDIAAITTRLRIRAPELVANARERLHTRLGELCDQLDSERIEQEIALLAQKADVAEELDRLDAHVSEVASTLASDKPVGRRLDFLIQELNREANTLGSKSSDADLTRSAVELKVLIEQMREQVQNVE